LQRFGGSVISLAVRLAGDLDVLLEPSVVIIAKAILCAFVLPL
jgi:hypothetical protein